MSRYKRRRPLPALALFVVLGMVAIFVWVEVLRDANDMNAATRCNAPTNPSLGPSGEPAAPVGQVLGHDALDRTDPIPASEVQVRVFNGGTRRNLAKYASIALTELGFQQAAEPDNDPVYPASDLDCRGQIRFGANGAQAARTLSIVDPCLELVRDDRQDATVDFAVGEKFDEAKPNSDARKVLDQLRAWAEQHPEQPGGQVAEASQPTLDPALLQAARNVHC